MGDISLSLSLSLWLVLSFSGFLVTHDVPINRFVDWEVSQSLWYFHFFHKLNDLEAEEVLPLLGS